MTLWVPWGFQAWQLSLRLEHSSSLRLREMLVQDPAELVETVREALLMFPSSSLSPSHQPREGAGQAWEEQLQCRPSVSQEHQGPSSWREPGGKKRGISGAPV